ncbi:uncharacterized protein LOC135818969 isoform X1 [Sycon ciliatum]|uniref:uncharacterized protein LOC135818969 isoform X1 n=1 Tax=Sycon ciliatum TaxID=27933 RepID=UPI0031F628A4
MAVTGELHLPSLATELVSVQSQQFDNLKESRAALKEINKRITVAEKRNKEQQLKLFTIEKDICILRSSCTQSDAKCEELKQGIVSLIDIKCKLRHEIADFQGRQLRLRSELLKSRKRMMAFMSASHRQEQQKPEFMAVVKAKADTSMLKDKCKILSQQLTVTMVMDDEDSRECAGDISTRPIVTNCHGNQVATATTVSSTTVNRRAHLETEKETLVDRKARLATAITDLQSHMKEETKKAQQAQQAIQLVKKRQLAQLTRLRRQVQDAQQRNNRWKTVASQYRQQIASLRREVRRMAPC